MKISFDYSILIREIQEELEDGVLSESDFVQILRAPEPLQRIEHRPIVDWYYDVNTMREMASPEFMDDEEDDEERKEMVQNYFRDFEHVETICVSGLLAEMEEWNRII